MTRRHVFASQIVLFVFLFGTTPAHAFYRVLIIGDSVGSGFGVPEGNSFVDLVKTKLRDTHHDLRLINLSAGGRTLPAAEKALDSILNFSGRPDICMLEIGGNDFLQGVPPALSAEILTRMCKRIQQRYPKTLILIIGLGYTSTEEASPYKIAALKSNVDCIDSFHWQAASASTMRQQDGVHPNEAGHRELAESILAKLRNHPQVLGKAE